MTQLLRPLTPRQTDVARLAAAGLGTTEIAKALDISYDAAKMHINAISDLIDNATKLPPLRLVRRWAVQQASLRSTPAPDAPDPDKPSPEGAKS